MGKQYLQAPRAFFVNRRKNDRRLTPDPCENMPIDLYHRKRRKQPDRRAQTRTLQQDFHAFVGVDNVL